MYFLILWFYFEKLLEMGANPHIKESEKERSLFVHFMETLTTDWEKYLKILVKDYGFKISENDGYTGFIKPEVVQAYNKYSDERDEEERIVKDALNSNIPVSDLNNITLSYLFKSPTKNPPKIEDDIHTNHAKTAGKNSKK